MTPEHQHLIDITLQLAHTRAADLAEQTDLPRGFRPAEQSVERLRSSSLGQRLATIANYVEGYPYQGDPENGRQDVRADVQVVTMTLFRDMLQQNTYRYPRHFHQSPLGQLLSQAMLRFFRMERPDRLIKVAEAAQLCNVRRQTIHEWADDGILLPIYDERGNVFFDRLNVERWQKQRHKTNQRQGRVN